MTRRLFAVVSACLAVSLLAAGCGDDSGDNGTAASTSPTTGATTSSSAPDAGPFTGAATTPTSVPAQSGGPALLTAVRTAPQSGYDRLVFEFEGPAPGYAVEYATAPFTNADTGAPIPIDGSSMLAVRLTSASSVDLSAAGPRETYTGPKRLKPADTAVISEVVLVQDFEATMNWGIGLRREAPYKVQTLTNPSRVVIDFQS